MSGALATAAGSNIVNNVPMALLALPVARHRHGPAREALTFAVLLGCNIGPTLTIDGRWRRCCGWCRCANAAS